MSMTKEKPNKRRVVRRCGSLSPEAGVTTEAGTMVGLSGEHYDH